MRVFHRTNPLEAEWILSEGFRDKNYVDQRGEPISGVELATMPEVPYPLETWATEHLAIEIPLDVLEPWEWLPDDPLPPPLEGLPERTREFLVPAEIVNRYGPPQILG